MTKRMYHVFRTHFDNSGYQPMSQPQETKEQAQKIADLYNMGADYSHATVREVIIHD